MPSKKEKKKVSESWMNSCWPVLKRWCVKYKAKLLGVDYVLDAKGDKMGQESMIKPNGIVVSVQS